MKKLFFLFICISYYTISFANYSGYVKVNVSSTPTGEGTVYATIETPTNNPNYALNEYHTNTTQISAGATSSANSIAYLYAQKSENQTSNYIFEKWTATSPTGWTSYKSKASVPVSATSRGDGATSSSSPKEYSLIASFKEAGAVIAVSSDETKGVVINSKIDNTVNETITLTAIENIFKGEFKYWLDPSNKKIYDKSFTLKVSDNNAGIYTAVFDDRDLTQGMYIMLYNEQTSKYLGLLGNNDDVSDNQRYFHNSILLADGQFAHSSPAFVLKISGSPDDYFNLTNIDFGAQGTSIKENPSASSGVLNFYRIKDGSYHIRGEFFSNIGFMCYSTTSGSNYGTPTTVEEHYGTVYHPGAYNGAGWNTPAHFWKIAILTEDEQTHCFGAEPKSTQVFDGKYYTTMYTAFPYRCLDGVNAFIVDRINNDGTIHLKKISSGIVPAETPVILQCNTTAAKTNRLLPLMEVPNSISETNYLKGEIWIKNYKNQESLTYIQNNTCYLNLSKISASDKKDEYTFEIPKAPEITPESQAYTSGESVPVTISCTSQGVSIKYSFDEGETWLDYASGASIDILDNTTIWAKAIDPENDFESEITTATYSFNPKSIHLDELPTTADQITYNIVDPLTVAYVDKNGIIYAKDDDGADEQSPGINETDFMDEHYGQNTYIDHSNWVAIDASSIDLPKITAGNSRIDVTGKVLALEASPNHTIKATRIEKIDDLGGFVPNTYCVVNFIGSHFQIDQTNYFFAAPQANEIAEVIWAQYNGNDTFVVPYGTGFTGTLNANFDLYADEDNYILKPGSQYRFIGLVNKLVTKDGGYKVYPLEGLKDMTITGVQTVETTGNIVSVKYYNMMGIESNVPFKGVNIVVTTYNDGSRTTTKVLR